MRAGTRMAIMGLVLLAFIPTSRAAKLAIAVMQIDNLGGVEPDQVQSLGQRLAQHIDGLGQYQVLDTSSIHATLAQKGQADLERCNEAACIGKVGKALGVRWVVAGSLMRFGGTYVLKLSLLDARMARVTASTSNQIKGNADDLLAALGAAVNSLFASARMKLHPRSATDTAAARKQRERTRAGVAEFENLMKDAEQSKVEQERRDKAWKIVARMAEDANLPVEVRQHAVRQFLGRFRSHNPYRKQALAYMNVLEPATLMVETQPPGATLIINGTTVGTSPLSRDVPAGSYRVVASLQGFQSSDQQIVVTKGQSANVNLLLTRAVLTHPYSTWGHATFWSGLGLTAFGAMSMGLSVKYANDYESGDLSAEGKSNTWSSMMFTGLGLGLALLTTGIILWAIEPPIEERLEPTTAAGLAPTGDGHGLVFSLGGRF